MFNLRGGAPRSSHQILNLDTVLFLSTSPRVNKTLLCVFPTVLFCLSCVVGCSGSTDPEGLYLSRDHLEHVGL